MRLNLTVTLENPEKIEKNKSRWKSRGLLQETSTPTAHCITLLSTQHANTRCLIGAN